MSDDGSETIRVPDLKKFIQECFCKIGVSKSNAEILADCLLSADLSGHYSHGIFRIDKYISDINQGCLDVQGQPEIIKESPASAWVDGKNSFGAIVGSFCMKIAIEKAKQVGAAIVTANHSNNFGMASFYSKQALKEGLLGFAVTNSSPLMVPTRAKESVIGTNPISLAAPGLFGDYFLLDMATTVASGGNVKLKYQNGEFLPLGWAVNAACLPETNADVAMQTGRLLPLGGSEEVGSYKGTGLSIMVDILSGILSGAHYAHMVGVWVERFLDQKANVGHCFIVIDPKRFASNFEVRLSEFMSHLRSLNSEDPQKPVLIPGDRGRSVKQRIDRNGGITYPKYVIDVLKNVSASLKLKCVPFVPKKQKIQMTPSEELAARLETEVMSVRETLSESLADDVLSIHPEEGEIKKEVVSFVMDTSSDWMCPITEFHHENDKSPQLTAELSKLSEDFEAEEIEAEEIEAEEIEAEEIEATPEENVDVESTEQEDAIGDADGRDIEDHSIHDEVLSHISEEKESVEGGIEIKIEVEGEDQVSENNEDKKNSIIQQ